MLEADGHPRGPGPGGDEDAAEGDKRKPERLVDASIALPLILAEAAWLGILGYCTYKLISLL